MSTQANSMGIGPDPWEGFLMVPVGTPTAHYYYHGNGIQGALGELHLRCKLQMPDRQTNAGSGFRIFLPFQEFIYSLISALAYVAQGAKTWLKQNGRFIAGTTMRPSNLPIDFVKIGR